MTKFFDHTNPDSAWVTQQARNLTWDLQEQGTAFRYLIHDRDSKFAKSFDQVFEAEGCEIVLTPLQAPDANSYSERWVRTARNECLDHILIFNQTHLVSVLREFEAYYNERRPHQGIEQRTPIMPVSSSQGDGPIRCRDVLGGIIHDYYRLAA